jgi:hypothetical protein
MALADALFELTVRWDDEFAPLFDEPACRRLERDLNHAIDHGTHAPLADVLDLVEHAAGTRNPVIQAMDAHRVRHADPGPQMPACRFQSEDATAWDSPATRSDETFLALVLRHRVADRGLPSPTRTAARRTTLSGLFDAGPLVRAVGRQGPAAPRVSAPLGRLVAFDPAEAFAELPAALRGWDAVSRLRLTARLVPAFQLPSMRADSAEAGIAFAVNAVLGAAHDPWGAGSWWATRNAWLGARPVDLLGSPRASEILPAARELTSGAW